MIEAAPANQTRIESSSIPATPSFPAPLPAQSPRIPLQWLTTQRNHAAAGGGHIEIHHHRIKIPLLPHIIPTDHSRQEHAQPDAQAAQNQKCPPFPLVDGVIPPI